MSDTLKSNAPLGANLVQLGAEERGRMELVGSQASDGCAGTLAAWEELRAKPVMDSVQVRCLPTRHAVDRSLALSIPSKTLRTCWDTHSGEHSVSSLLCST